ncbi:MAG: hypothetical protein HYX77_03800 [Acidobacteria bacterium]|nr:hypothetical protein [Acidobacteriota bacterium]
MAMHLSGAPCFRLTIAAVSAVAAIIGTRGGATFFATGRDAAISALAPVEVVALGFDELSAIAVDAYGAALVTDRRAGTVTRIGPAGFRQTVLDDLHKPGGVAVDEAGRVFVIEEGTRVLRLDAEGIVSVVAASVRQARTLATGPDGRIWISTRREQGPEFEIVQLEASGALTSFASGFIDARGLAVDETAVYAAIASMTADSGHERTTLARIPLRAGEDPGLVEPMLRNTPRRPYGVAIDAAGDVFVSGTTGDHRKEGSGVILKRRAGGQLDTLAAGLRDPVALAFAPSGDLLAVEKSGPARVLRFRAPPPPEVSAPPFTNRRPLRIDGRATPGDLVRVLDTSNGTQALAATSADPATGGFTLETPLAANRETHLSFVATAAGGRGLVGPARVARVVHDDHLPRVAITQPFPGTHVRGAAILRARADDEGSGVASMRFMQDDSLVATFQNAAPGQPLVAAAVLDTASWTEGPHALTVAATDRAGNTAAGAQLLVVDRTPPDTRIVTGPPERTAENTAIFTFTGADVQSADLDFTWRLDGAPWSAFSASPAAEITAITPGLHRFEVKARDRAGNEDSTPAVQTFTVTALRIHILEPAPGAAIATETFWVRGIVESGGREVSVTISLPPEFRVELSLETLPAATEAGTFAAEAPATPSMTAVAVTARDGQGATVTEVVNIEVQSRLTAATNGFAAFPEAGLAPHAVRFGAGAIENVRYSLDLESDGTTDYDGGSLAEREFTYTRPGIYVATLRTTTRDGQTATSRTLVQVYDRTVLDARLQTVWRAFKGALQAGEVQRAVMLIHTNRRAGWQEYFSRLPPALLGAADTVFTDVALLDVGPGSAVCEMMRDVDGLLYSFPVSFRTDVDGGWRLWQF